MKKTFTTKLPDQAGSFMEVSKVIAELGGNITRVSYNKSIDTHMLFLDVESDRPTLAAIVKKLRALGFVSDAVSPAQVMLLSFRLPDRPGSLVDVLKIIYRYKFNISYINSIGDGSEFQDFKMGLFVENPTEIKQFLEEATQLCEVTVIDYNKSEKVLDNTVFYIEFANQIAGKLELTREAISALMSNSNELMQEVGLRNEPPQKTFEYIGKYVDMLAKASHGGYKPRTGQIALSHGITMHVIEPPCGSNTYILDGGRDLLFIDSGFNIFADELTALCRELIPNFDGRVKELLITHPDMDHCGALGLFEKIYVSPAAREHFVREVRHRPNFREKNPRHAPYCRISRIIAKYTPPRISQLKLIGGCDESDAPLAFIGSLQFESMSLDVYRGNGGHAEGEVVIVSESEKLVFSGDIAVNAAGFTKEQAEFNSLAPYLMSSVNMDSKKATLERNQMQKMFPPGEYTYCFGHGSPIKP